MFGDLETATSARHEGKNKKAREKNLTCSQVVPQGMLTTGGGLREAWQVGLVGGVAREEKRERRKWFSDGQRGGERNKNLADVDVDSKINVEFDFVFSMSAWKLALLFGSRLAWHRSDTTSSCVPGNREKRASEKGALGRTCTRGMPAAHARKKTEIIVDVAALLRLRFRPAGHRRPRVAASSIVKCLRSDGEGERRGRRCRNWGGESERD